MVQLGHCTFSLHASSCSSSLSWQVLSETFLLVLGKLNWIIPYPILLNIEVLTLEGDKVLRGRFLSGPSMTTEELINFCHLVVWLWSKTVQKLCRKHFKEMLVFWEGMCQFPDFSWNHGVKFFSLFTDFQKTGKIGKLHCKHLFVITQFWGSKPIN